MFFVKSDTYEGLPARLYREPEEIRRDIQDIRERIEKTESMLNVRGVLTEILSRCQGENPEVWVGQLERLVCEARETLLVLERLNESLDILSEELEETRWILSL